MTRLMRSSALTIGWMIVVAGTGVANAGDSKSPTPEKILEEKGLTKEERKFLLDESAALKQVEQTQTDYAAFQKAFKRYAAILEYDETVQNMEMERQGLQQQNAMLQMQINNASRGVMSRMRGMVNQQLAPIRAQVQMNQQMVTQMNAQLQAFKGQAPKADERKRAPEDFKQTRQTLMDSNRELEDAVTPLLEKYHELALDKDVIDALAQLKHSTALNYKLGPSDELVAASKLIREVKLATTGTAKTAKKKKKTTAKSKSSS